MLSVIRLYLVLQLANGVAGQSCTDTIATNTNCTSDVYKTIKFTSGDECCAACAADPECVQWSYAAVRVCFLSRTKGKTNRYLGFTCGFKSAAPPSPPTPVRPNIVKLAESVSDLSTLVAAVVAGDLADTLSSPGPFTVFAPTNEAFAALPAGTLSKLMKPENKKELVDILTYHVLPEQVLSNDLKPFQAVKTVEGKPLHVTKWGDRVRLGPSLESKDLKNVVKVNNLASNGVVHIIDGVLLPPSSLSIVV